MARPRKLDREGVRLKLPSDEEIERNEEADREAMIDQDTKFQEAMMAAIASGLERPTG